MRREGTRKGHDASPGKSVSQHLRVFHDPEILQMQLLWIFVEITHQNRIFTVNCFITLACLIKSLAIGKIDSTPALLSSLEVGT